MFSGNLHVPPPETGLVPYLLYQIISSKRGSLLYFWLCDIPQTVKLKGLLVDYLFLFISLPESERDSACIRFTD